MACLCSMMLSHSSEDLKAAGQLDQRGPESSASSCAQGLVPKQEEPEVQDCHWNREPFCGAGSHAAWQPQESQISDLVAGDPHHGCSSKQDRRPHFVCLILRSGSESIPLHTTGLQASHNSAPIPERVIQFYLLRGEQQDSRRADKTGFMFVAIFRKYISHSMYIT